VRTDPDKDEEFVNSKDWGAEIEALIYVERQDESSDGPRSRMHSLSGGERNRLFLAGLDYEDISLLSGVDCPEGGRGFALWDYNEDGFQDLVVMSPMAPRVQVFRNEISKVLGAQGERVAIKLVGGNQTAAPSKELSNRDSVGATVRVTDPDGGKRLFQRSIGEGFSSQNSGWIWIGMGQHKSADIEVIWPSGKRKIVEGVSSGTKLEISEVN